MGKSGGAHRRELKANCEWNPISLWVFRVDGVEIHVERTVSGARTYPRCHPLCHCERREPLREDKEVEERLIKYLRNLATP
jgi:hypothetical protein